MPKKSTTVLTSSSRDMYQSVDLLIPKLVNRMAHTQRKKIDRRGIRQIWRQETLGRDAA